MKLFEYIEHIGDWRVLIQTRDIRDAAITTRLIADGAVTEGKIAEGAVTETKIGTKEVKERHIADDQIKERHIDDKQIKERHIDDDQIKAEHIDNKQIKSRHIDDDQIKERNIDDGQIKERHIAPAQIKERHIDDDQIKDYHIDEKQIKSDHIDDDQIKERHIDDAQIKERHIDDDQIKERHIDDGQIKERHIDTHAVTTDKLSGSKDPVTGEWTTPPAVGNEQLAPGAITPDKLSDGLIEDLQEITDAEPTAGSMKPAQSGGVLNSIIRDGSAFDLSAYNNGDTYADLSAALTAMNALPAAYKKGGMSIKYVQSSSTKYVQYRLMSDEFSTTPSDWQGIDDKPTPGSKNLVESGGVKGEIGNLDKLRTTNKNSLVNAINEISPHSTEEDGLYICDANGQVLIRLDVLDSKNGIGENLMNYITSQITPLIPDTVVKDTDKNGFYICNEEGEAVAVFADNQWTLLSVVEKKRTGSAFKRGNIASGDTWVINKNSVKHGNRIMFSGKITSFDTITIGHGTIAHNGASWIVVDDTNLYVHYHNLGSGEQSGYPKTYAHGLTIKDNIQVEIVKNNTNTAKVVITSGGSRYETSTDVTWYGSTQIYLSSTSILSDCSFGWTSKQIYTDIWLFGDSYFSLDDNNRWTTYLFSEGYTNFMLDGRSGEGSLEAFADLTNLLNVYTPKMIVWCVGMNNADTSDAVNATWKSVLDSLITLCHEKNIELVLATIPTVVGGWNPDTQSNNLGIHKYKNAIVRESGYRYIDFDSAVGANENTGEWFNNGEADDMLENYGQQSGRIHPTTYGAKALYYQAISDCPELTK